MGRTAPDSRPDRAAAADAGGREKCHRRADHRLASRRRPRQRSQRCRQESSPGQPPTLRPIAGARRQIVIEAHVVGLVGDVFVADDLDAARLVETAGGDRQAAAADRLEEQARAAGATKAAPPARGAGEPDERLARPRSRRRCARPTSTRRGDHASGDIGRSGKARCRAAARAPESARRRTGSRRRQPPFAAPARHCRQNGFAASASTSARLSPMSFSI